ncbi:MAG: hypothetical protein H6797_03215 [Candidatus Nomurabacteria bacterium]|nr:MAG: hypothetical protein H6797_03215 [Candidatus Nomurabacteria bacterium]
MSNNIDLTIRSDARRYVQEACTDAVWRQRADEVRAANGGMLPREWGCFPPMPSLVSRVSRQLVDQV